MKSSEEAMAPEESMSVRDTASVLNVSLQQVYRLIWDGRLSGRKVDGQWRVSADAVEARRKERDE
jgi:excisionase family DNA binding protein